MLTDGDPDQTGRGGSTEGAKEVELKFHLASGPGAIRHRLAEIGARGGPPVHEIDIYLDLPGGRLAAEGRVLRLRRDASGVLLTYKGPPAPGTIFSEREERQVRLADLEAILGVLEALGYRPARRKEKIRESFSYGEVTICLDRLPFLGYYLEIEGPRRAIARAAAQLGLDLESGTNLSYLELFQRYGRERATDPGPVEEMLFAAEEAARKED